MKKPTGRPNGRPKGSPQPLAARIWISAKKAGVPHPESSHEHHAEAARRRWADPAYREAHAAAWARKRAA